MPKLIQDKFSSVPSRQRRYQLRKEAAGRCRICGERGAPYCVKHREQQRELARHAHAAHHAPHAAPAGQSTRPEDLI